MGILDLISSTAENQDEPSKPTSDRSSGSFLVRFWREPSASGEGKHELRGYVRNLKTGEERYVKDTSDLPEAILEELGYLAPLDKEK